jgi:hypothetical protein
VTWVDEIKKRIDAAISNRQISKSELAEGLEDIEDHAGEWARQQRRELESDED